MRAARARRRAAAVSLAFAALVPITVTSASGPGHDKRTCASANERHGAKCSSPAKLVLLLGDRQRERSVASVRRGRARAFRFTAARSGTARKVSLYVAGGTRASRALVALYSNASGRPGQLLTTGSRRRPARRAWNTIAVRSVSLVAGRTYWLAVLGAGGALSYRERARGPCSSSAAAQRHLAAFPKRWTSDGSSRGCPISAYVLGAAVAQPPPQPPPKLPPVVVPPAPTLTCTTTLGPGANLAAAIDGAGPGAVICLQTGDYPKISLSHSYHSGYVTLQAAPGATPTVAGLYAVGVSFLRVQGLKMTAGIDIRSDGHDLQLIGNDIGNADFGIAVDQYSPSPPITGILIEGNFIHDLDRECATPAYATGQGVTLSGGEALIAGNTFQTIPEHYIQGGDNTVVDGNVFQGPRLSCPNAHLNIWQIWSGGRNDAFINNVMRPGMHTSNSIMFETGPGGANPSDTLSNITISNNLFDHETDTYSIQECQTNGLTITNNTIVGSTYGLWARNCSGTGSSYDISRNIVVQNAGRTPEIQLDGCAGTCTFDYNVTDDGSADQAGSTHYVIHWNPQWQDTTWYQPIGLSFQSGFTG